MLLIIALELFVFFFHFFYFQWYFFISVTSLFLYAITKYIWDDASRTGARAWKELRRFKGLGKVVNYYMGDLTCFSKDGVHKRMLLVVTGDCYTLMGMTHAFGLHHGTFEHVDLVFIVPHFLMRVPLLRDVLMWLGAVATDRDEEGLILELLQKGKSVAYRLPESQQVPPAGLLQFAANNGIHVVPVCIRGEEYRYRIIKFPKAQQWLESKTGWNFPVFFPKSFDVTLEVQVGTPMNASLYKTQIEKFTVAFTAQLQQQLEV